MTGRPQIQSVFGLWSSAFGLRSSVFSFCVPCLTVGAVPLLTLPRNRESVNVNVILSGVIKSVGLNFVPAVLRGNKKNRSSSAVDRYFLYKKKSRKTKNCPVCILEIFDLLSPCILQGTHNNNSRIAEVMGSNPVRA